MGRRKDVAAKAGPKGRVNKRLHVTSALGSALPKYSIDSRRIRGPHAFSLFLPFFLSFRSSSSTVPPIKTLAKLKAKEAKKSSSGRPDIASWINSAAASEVSEDMEDASGEFVWHRERVVDEWPQAMQFAHAKLMIGRTSERVLFLQEELLPLAKSNGALRPSL